MILNREDTSFAFYATGYSQFGDALHRRLQDFRVSHARYLHTVEFAKRPSGIVVGSLLRILWAPVLMIQKSVRDARVRLVHANHVAARRKRLARWLRLLVFLPFLFVRRLTRFLFPFPRQP